MAESTEAEPFAGLLDLDHERHYPLRIDPHCHILPGVDDGAPDLQTSLAMARRAAASGVEIMVATPHANHPAARTPMPPQSIRQRTRLLQNALEEAQIPVQLHPGQELLLDEHLPARFESGQFLTWADQNRYVLVELGFHRLPRCSWDVLDYFVGRHLSPIIAHPERYTWWDRHPDALSRLMDRNVVFQFNVMSLTGHWGDEIRRRAVQLMGTVPAWILGTDSHNADDRFWGITEARQLTRIQHPANG